MVRTGIVVFLSTGLLGGPLHADTITHFGDGPFPGVSTLLDDVDIGIGSGNTGSETTAETFVVPGASGTTTTLTFTFEEDLGGYLFTFGFYPLSAVSGIDPETEKVDYAIQAITNATLIFDDVTQDPGVTASFPVLAGTELGFFIVPNDTFANFLADPTSFYDPPANTGDDIFANKRSPLFSVADANPGEFDQLLSFIGNGVTLFTFEDLTRNPGGNTDNSFTDLAFTIDSELEPVVNDPPDCSEAALSAGGCWPPNHTYTLVQVTGVTDPDGDPVTIQVTGVTQDEPVKSTSRGSGSTCPDAVLVDTDDDGEADAAGLRCERDGTGNGRVYTVSFTASDNQGAVCQGSATFCVVKSQAPGAVCVDDGQTHDSTACPGTGAGAGELDGPSGVISLEEFGTLTPEPLFIRGDTNFDEQIDLGDAVMILHFLFQNRDALACAKAADVNDDSVVDISDPISVLSFLFLGGGPPAPPFEWAGIDPTLDGLNCE